MWKLKVLLQFILALLPGGERLNYLLQVLNKSHSPEQTVRHFTTLAEKIKLVGEHVCLEGSTVLEIGTGWDAISAILFSLMGTKICYTYDHLPHVRFKLVRQIISQIEEQIRTIHLITSVPESVLMNRLMRLKHANNLKELFKAGNIIYMAPGDAARTGLEDNSVDLIYSYAVLEHVPENIINDIIIESERILKKKGKAYFAIGLHDHYSCFDKKISKVNFLQYPEWLWAFFVKNRISYHNRLREKQFTDIFKSHGAKIEWISNKTDPSDLDVLKTMKTDTRFAGMTHKELAVHYSELILTF